MPSISATPATPISVPLQPVPSAIEFVTLNDFATKVLQSPQPVAVEFMSYACPHCRRMEPVIEDVAAGLSGRMKVYKVNVPQQPQLASYFGITGTPTFVMFANGREVGRGGAGPVASEVRAALLRPFAE